MAPSSKKFSAAAAASTAAILLLLVVAAEMASIGEANTCRHLSGDCALICQHESSDNTGGACDDNPPRCYCITNC
uniref:Knottin scorpion toxin-like domain-containing protein n=1 Tax=Setaria viridis TaxID=4556 RepID=A0A4U6TIZ4_SETVI|nr:hypothetical protein SEVIR_8G144300v2 [Setaria viridis]